MSKEENSEKGVQMELEHIDLSNNIAARIQNPLHGIPADVLEANVAQFCKEKGFTQEADLFRRAAFLAQKPGAYESLELFDDEKQWIRMETTREPFPTLFCLTPPIFVPRLTPSRDEDKWKNPKTMYLTVVLCSIGAAVQGWDQEGSNGANLSFPQALGIPESGPDASKNQWIVGLINSAPYIAACLFGVWWSDPLNNWFGRRGTIFIAAIFCTLPVFGAALSQTWQQLLVCRLLLGIGMGCKGSTVPIFAAENVPAQIRGGLVMCWQLWVAFGIFLGVTANLILMDVGKNAWRLQMGSAFLPAIPLLLGVFLCPESPRWLLKKGRYQESFRSFLRLRNHPIQAARDLYHVHCQLQEEASIIGKQGSYLIRFVELFTIPRNRRASLAAAAVMLAQQMCGINIIAFYSSNIFADAGYSSKDALLASFGFGAVNFLFAIPAIFTIDTFGRRNLLLFTFPNMAWSLLASGLCFLIPDGNSARVPLIALFIYIFCAFYSPGEGPVPFTYAAEVFPLSHREVGMAFAVAVNMFFASALGLTFPRMVGAMGNVGAFCFYAGLNLLATVMLFLIVPETKQRTLEELDQVFAVPTTRHMSYQTGTWLPWFISRYIFCNKRAELEPLYNFDAQEVVVAEVPSRRASRRVSGIQPA